MDRRGFLASMLGLGAAAALPAPALDFLDRTSGLTDIAFELATFNDPEWSSWIEQYEQYTRAAAEALCRAIDKEILDTLAGPRAAL